MSFDAFEVPTRRDCLSQPGDRSTELGQEIGRFRKGNHFEAHSARLVSYDVEGLFATFRVTGQRAIGKTETPGLIGAVDNPARYEQVQRAQVCSGYYHGPGV
jgi:hypothetical protein